MEYVLEMRDIVKIFPGVKALDHVNLKVKKGKIHVICGENGAGKSTLMKTINGAYKADGGQMFFDGKLIENYTVQDTINMGIAMIYQELNPVLEMTIAENVFLGNEPKKGYFVDYKKLYDDTQKLLDRLNIPYKATQKMIELSIAGHQLIEIAKAIARNAKVIIMDEPSSAIADAEIDILFEQIFSLKSQGVAILYITHKMDEIFRIADEITIIRDGVWIESGDAANYTSDLLISKMVGREIKNIFPKDNTVPIGEVILEVKNLTQEKIDGGRFKDISFDLRKGEILGFSGLVGAGRSEVMRAIFGLDKITSGQIIMNGKEIDIKHSSDAIKNGIAMVSEDRKGQGLVLGCSVRDNTVLANLKDFVNKGLINDVKIDEKTDEMVKFLQVKTPNIQIPVANLSGGNQQKIVLAKWLIGDVKVIILDEPTRGIDVRAKSEIHRIMCEFAREGMAIIMISSELPEILGMSDRVVVMQEGYINGILNREEATQENIMYLATKGRRGHD